MLRNHRQRHFELLAAVAAQRSKNISREALRVNAHQRRAGVHVPHHQRDGFFSLASVVGIAAGKSVNAEMSPAGREVRGGDLFDLKCAHKEIIVSEIRNNMNIVVLRVANTCCCCR